MKKTNKVRHPDVQTTNNTTITKAKHRKAVVAQEPQQSQQVEKEIFSYRSHNMQYFDMQGIKERTGYDKLRDLYLMVIKELLDNAVDFLQNYYRGAEDARVTAMFRITEDEKKIGTPILNCKVRNSNPENKFLEAFTVEELYKILDYSMSYGSKQTEYKISRGFLGDASKQILALAYAILNRGVDSDDSSAFFKKQWEIPMYFRANGFERRVTVHVNKAASEAINTIIESPERLPHTDTEIEVTLPLIDIKTQNYYTYNTIDLDTIEKYCRRYPIFTTDVSFDIRLIDEIKDERRDIITAAKHAIVKNWNNSTSIWRYKPEEFVARIESVYDRDGTSLYDIIRKFKEGAQMPKKQFNKLIGVDDVDKLSIRQFMQFPDYQTKAELLYHKLRGER